ncbi:hypothetical protein A2U01_0068087, partial [Trifolium medium]|nr:hypothetical protein [Trifolium medium]
MYRSTKKWNTVMQPGQDENIDEDKNLLEVDKNSIVSRDEAMAANMDYAVSGGDMPADKIV